MVSSEALTEIVFVSLEVWAFVFSVFGNSIVIYVMTREKKLRRKSNYYIISVAIADILIGLVGIPCSIYMRLTGGPHDLTMCLGIISFLLGILSVSIFSLVAISLDRYCAICHPILYHKRTGSLKATKPIIAICWLLGILGYFPLFGWNVGMRENKCHPSVVLSFEYIMFLCVAAAFVPATAIIVIYSLIFKEINVQSKLRLSISFRKKPVEATQRKEHKTAKTLSMIVGTFIVCWLPMTVSYFLYAVREQKFTQDILDVFTILSHFNSAIDPLIYAYRIKDVRETIKSMFMCLTFKSSSQINQKMSSTVKTSKDVEITKF